MSIVGTSSDLGQPFCPTQKKVGFGSGREQVIYLAITLVLKEGSVLFNNTLNTFYL